MCGIVGGISFKEIGPLMLRGLKRLEYRGYDSAGLAVINHKSELQVIKIRGKVHTLEELFLSNPIAGGCGLAHTRWATHGIPSKENAHPHTSNGTVAVVHNGIIENYEPLKEFLVNEGYQFNSETDSEVLAHLIHHYLLKTNDLLSAVQQTVNSLEGMYAIGVICTKEPNCLIAARSGSPLVIGLGHGENYIASDNLALLAITHQFTYLEEGDVAKIEKDQITIYDKFKEKVVRKVVKSTLSDFSIDRAQYSHYMEKEIFEQPQSVARTLEGRITKKKVVETCFGIEASEKFKQIKQVTLVACGTSYHAALVGKYWLEELAGISCQVDIASEYRYRHPVIPPDSLFVALSQSGETADTLASFRLAKTQNYLSTLAICNVPESSLVRESELMFLTRAGPEIGVASTKSFLTQLCALLLLTIAIGRHHNLTEKDETEIINDLWSLPKKMSEALSIKAEVKQLAEQLTHKDHMLFLGRGSLYPIAMEGALKLKEITYIHAEAYPAGELKHGPLALVDKNMPVIVVAPNNDLFEKLKSNLHEIRARGGQLIIFADGEVDLKQETGIQIIKLPSIEWILAPILYVIPLQLLAYYIGILKGTDVDQPRNLAKSVTVE